MREHVLVDHDNGRGTGISGRSPWDRGGSPSKSSKPTSAGMQEMRFVPCKHHPDEPLQFFCLDCETECICAECAVHGEHKDHEVLNVKKAYQNLCNKVESLLDVAKTRVEELGTAMNRLEVQKRDLEAIAVGGRQGIRDAFEQVRRQISQKEAEVLRRIDEAAVDANRQLEEHAPATEEKIRTLQESQSKLQRFCNEGQDVQALNWYATAKHTMDDLLSRREANPEEDMNGLNANFQRFQDISGNIKEEVQRHLDEVANVGSSLGKLRAARLLEPPPGSSTEASMGFRKRHSFFNSQGPKSSPAVHQPQQPQQKHEEPRRGPARAGRSMLSVD